MKIAVLGLGFMGTTHLRNLLALPDVEVAAVFDCDEKRLEGDLSSVQGNLGGPAGTLDLSRARKYRELDRLLADPAIDAVDVCLPTNLHAAAAIRALRAGKHVLVEKPMALDGEAADSMVSEAERHGRVLMTAQVLRFSPEYIALREAVRQGQWGQVRSAVFRRRCAAPAWSGWLKDPAVSGGGAFDLLIHDADICLHLFGVPQTISATGYEDRAAGIDCIQAQLLYLGGVAVLVAGGWYHAAYPFSMEYTVALDAATVEFSSAGHPPTLYAADQPARVLPLQPGDGYAAEVAYFVECCRGGKEAGLCPPRESADAVKLMLAMIDARRRNGEVMECRI